MFCERTNEGAAQTTTGEFQEETKNGEATLRAQKKEQMFMLAKQTKVERCPDRVRVQQDCLLFYYRS
jgi:hypothetical protein